MKAEREIRDWKKVGRQSTLGRRSENVLERLLKIDDGSSQKMQIVVQSTESASLSALWVFQRSVTKTL